MEWLKEIKLGNMNRILGRMSDLSSETQLLIHTTTGKDLNGRVITSDSENYILLLDLNTKQPNELVFLPISSVSFLQITNPLPSIGTLTENAIARNPLEQAPSNLQLNRLCEELFSDLKPAIKFDQVQDLSTVAKLNFKDLLPVLKEALITIKKDPLGEKALSAISTVHLKFENLPEPVCVLLGNELILRLNLDSSLGINLKDHLIKTIEKAL